MPHSDHLAGTPLAVRIMTYNVHRCQGSDGAFAPARVAQVIAACRPDVVALQEVDVGRSRSGFVHQAESIARELGMDHQFFPSMHIMEGQYGNAILSRLPARLVKAGHLPQAWRAERRGVLRARVETPAGPFEIFNTHLGLRAGERRRQIAELLGEEWLGDVPPDRPAVLAGDFNTLPWSRSYRDLARHMRDVQTVLKLPAGPTFPARRPLFRLDHLFVNGAVAPLSIDVVRSPLALLASDHLPLVAELARAGHAPEAESADDAAAQRSALETAGGRHEQ